MATDEHSYTHKLYLSDFLRGDLIQAAIRQLGLPAGSRGLDAGCGIGSHISMLAKAVGPKGHVTGLDQSPDMLAQARQRAEQDGLGNRVLFQQGDVNHLPFAEHTFDWIWSVDCVGYGYPGRDSMDLLRGLAATLKPGGLMALLMWSSQQLLPGYPLLEARLNATAAGIAPFVQGMEPSSHHMRLLGRLRQVGLDQTRAQTFLGQVAAPLSGRVRQALVSLFGMRWGGARGELSPEDWELYQSLTQADSLELILDCPDYYAFFTYTMFSGRKAG